jgi:class 3 adenylate cyclase
MTTKIKTILDLDLVGYSSIVHAIEDALQTKHVLELNDQIQSFVDKALGVTGTTRPDALLTTTGDGAILGFDSPSKAYEFAIALHEAARNWNDVKSKGIAQRLFRIGIATGPIEVREQNGVRDFAGFVIARAVRLEANAEPGQILVDEETFQTLPVIARVAFTGPRKVRGKRDEVFESYSCTCFVPDPKAIAAMVHSANPFDRIRGAHSDRDIRREVLRLLHSLRPHQYEELIFLLMIPIDRRPPRSVPIADRRGMILEWAAEEPNGVVNLCESLKLVTQEGLTSQRKTEGP